MMTIDDKRRQVLRDALVEFVQVRARGIDYDHPEEEFVRPYVQSRYAGHPESFKAGKVRTVFERVCIAMDLVRESV